MKALVFLISLSCLPISLNADDTMINQSSSTNQIAVNMNKNSTMTVITMNIAHGRRDKFHQAFLGKNRIKDNLDHIVEISHREAPFLIALQEADGPSFWSGKFNHVEYLSNQT